MEIREIKATKPSNQINGNKINRKRVAAYCRVSTNDEDQLSSYASQKKHYTDLIKENKEWQFVEVYADAAVTGTQVKKRVDFQRLINDGLNGDIDLIITKSISRFARNTYDTLKYVRMLKDKNVAVYFEEENINTLTMDGELLLTILSSVAQQEVENISENVKKGLKMKMKRGELTGSHGCLGYDYDLEDRTLSINEEGAKVVREIFELYVSGYGATLICKELNARGVPTPRGKTWTNGSIIRIIKNEKYMGDLLLGKTITVDPISKRRIANRGEEDRYYIKEHHEPIIDRDTFEKAHDILDKRSFSRKPKDGNITREKYSRKYAFSSMIECGFCGGIFSRRKWHSSSKYKKAIWQCRINSQKGKSACEHSKGISEEIIELAFLESYAMICGRDREIADSFIKRLEISIGSDTVSKKIKSLDGKLYKLEAKKKKLLDLLLEGHIEQELFDSSLFKLGNEQAVINEQLEEFNIQLDNEKVIKERIASMRKALSGDVKIEEFDRVLFENLIEKIVIGKIDENGNADPYHIKFIYKAGLNNAIDGFKHRKDGRMKNVDVLPTNSNDKGNTNVHKQSQQHIAKASCY